MEKNLQLTGSPKEDSLDPSDLLLSVYRAIIESGDLSSGLRSVLEITCEFIGWTIGTAWLPSEDKTEILFCASRRCDDPKLNDFIAGCHRQRFGPRIGLVGRVWHLQKTEWIRNLALESVEATLLAPVAANAELKAAMAVPIISDGQVDGVLMFHAREAKEEDPRIVAIISGIATQLGFALKHKNTEGELLKQSALVGQSQEERERQVRPDISEVRRGQAWLQSLIETTQDAVLSIDRQGRVLLFNPAAERIFGYARNEVIGQKVNILMAEPYATEHDGYIERYERTGEAHAIGRIRTVTARRKNAELFPVELSVTEIAVDRDVHYAAFIRDISEKNRLQKQLVETERLAAIGTTAAKIGHELANPLNGMSLTVQLLEQRLRRIADSSDDQLAPTVKRLKDEISRLQKLVGEFGTISRKEKYVFRPVNLAQLVEDIVTLQAPHLSRNGIEILTSLATDLPLLSIDGDKMKQALLNLIKNAGEAMPQGGKIAIEVSIASAAVIVEITDTGAGIPLDIDAFEPFTTTKKQGTGVGLVIVRQIVTAHDGKISYRSKPGQGTTFRLELPVKV